jgi:DNA-binding transcriptional LysR family regulator
MQKFIELEHVQIAPRGTPGGYLDDLLAEQGQKRRVARAVPYFLAGLLLVARTDYVVTISERLARAMEHVLDLEIYDPPLLIKPYVLNLVWHPRMEADSGHRWLRDVLVRVAKEL